MTTVKACGTCGTLLPMGADACLRCGGAASVDHNPRAARLMLAGAGVIAVCTVVLLLVAGVRALASTMTSGLSTAVSTTPTAAPAPAPTPIQWLQGAAAADQPEVESLVGYWVPQVSAKRIGVTDSQGLTYDGYDDIVANHGELVARWPHVLLVNSDDYTSFGNGPTLWISIVGNGFTTAAAANNWCDERGIRADDCYATRLSHTSTAVGNTAHR